MSFLEYEKSENLFVQALKGTALGSSLRNVEGERWTVLVPQSVILDELGIAVVSPEFLKTHTVVFDVPDEPQSFTTLNGLKGVFVTSSGDGGTTERCDSVIVTLPQAARAKTTPTPLGPAAADSPLETHTAEVQRQTIHILRQTELLLDPTDGFTVSIHLVSDAVRAKWLSGDSVEDIGWFGESQQQPRQAERAKPAAVSAAGGAPAPQKSPKKARPEASSVSVTPQPEADGGASSQPSPAAAAGSAQPSSGPQRPKQFRFRDFAEKMRGAKELHAELRNFVSTVNTSTDITDAELPGMVRDFLAHMFDEIKQSVVWKGATEQELDFAQEGVEKYTLTKIFTRTFSTEEDQVKDDALEKRLQSFEFITPENLDVREEVLEHPTWREAVEELCKLNDYKNPRDKLICITNCCKLIFSMLHNLDPNKTMGADDFLPCLILLVGKAGAKNLHSNTAFIENYRNDNKMSCEAGYYFCTLQSAIHFWETADADSLRISQETLDNINAGLAGKQQPDFNDVSIDEGDRWELEKTQRAVSAGGDRNPLDAVSPQPDLAVDLLPSASTLQEQLGAALQAHAPSGAPLKLDGLTVGDLPALLVEYRRLRALHADVAKLNPF